ncbi:MAG: hypothetical protein EAZ27_03815 [Cytophagales bacterium]|nr:MAG: hypothetical protein EAZ27_03815 [Cytophagales bacterium]
MIQSEFGKRIKTGLLIYTNLLKQPLISVKEVQEICHLSPKASGDLIRLFVEINILKEFEGKFRSRIYIYHNYVNLFEDK